MKSKPKENGSSKRDGSLKVQMEFDDLIRRVIKVRPPAEGWADNVKKRTLPSPPPTSGTTPH